MINKDFLKKLSVLYVEDEDIAREKLAKVLKRLFKEVYLAPNGMEGYIQFQKLHFEKTPVDIVLSDINMPKMSGIEMLEQIREVDKEVPFIFTTARSESENLLRAIELKVNHYILKPINSEDVVLKCQEACQKKYYEKELEKKNSELKEYLGAINNVALVLKVNKDYSIEFINDSFVSSLQVPFEEIFQKNFFTFLHDSTPKDKIENIKKVLEEEKKWEGNLKFKAKDEDFFINSTFFEIEESDENKLLLIGFLNTKESLEKRDFKRKVIQNIQEQNKRLLDARNESEKLKIELKKYINLLNNTKKELELEQQKSKAKLQQINHYESEVLDLDEKQYGALRIKNKQIEDYKKVIAKLKKDKEMLYENINKLEEEIVNSKLELERKRYTIELKDKRIEDLKDVVSYRESQIREIQPDLLYKEE